VIGHRVVLAIAELVRTAIPDEIRRDDAMTRADKFRDDVAIEVGPRRMAVQKEDGAAAAGPSST